MERVPQWSHEETVELLKIRAELDKSFMETKRNKVLWETVSLRMRAVGYPRTAEQCKSKWKNLLTRFKGSETMEVETSRQFPFHEEMQRIFSERMVMRSLLMGGDDRKGKEVVRVLEENDQSSDDHEDQCEDQEKKMISKKKKKRRRRKGEGDEVVDVLKEIVRRQGEMEERWMKEVEEREEERRLWEEEWRRTMEDMVLERMEMERRWREREEERKATDDARADRRHSLLTAILTKLSENNH